MGNKELDVFKRTTQGDFTTDQTPTTRQHELQMPDEVLSESGKGLNVAEARAYLRERQTFFHMLFTIREKVGGDVQLIDMLGFDSQIYFNFMQQRLIPDSGQLRAIFKVVYAHKEFRPLYFKLQRAANIERTIEAGNIHYGLGQQPQNMAISPDASAMRRNLHKIREQAEQETKIMLWKQSELVVHGWLSQNQTISDTMQEMVTTAGGKAVLAAKLKESEALIGSCVRSGIRHRQVIERIINKLRHLDDTDRLKPFADQLEKSIAMEIAIDAGAITETSILKRRSPMLPLVDAATIQRFQQELHHRRMNALLR